MPVDPGDVVKAVAEFVLADGTIAQNVLHFLAVFAAQQSDTPVLTAIRTYIEDLYESVDDSVDENVTVNPATVHVVVWDGGEGKWVTDRLIGYTEPDITFASVTDPQPNQISPVLVANTQRPKTRGRKFLIPFADDSANGSEWASGVLTSLGTSLLHFLADQSVGVDADLSPGVVRTEADEFYQFTDGVVNSIVGTQRRRKPGVGA